MAGLAESIDEASAMTVHLELSLRSRDDRPAGTGTVSVQLYERTATTREMTW